VFDFAGDKSVFWGEEPGFRIPTALNGHSKRESQCEGRRVVIVQTAEANARQESNGMGEREGEVKDSVVKGERRAERRIISVTRASPLEMIVDE
jgi:hypothetical protein